MSRTNKAGHELFPILIRDLHARQVQLHVILGTAKTGLVAATRNGIQIVFPLLLIFLWYSPDVFHVSIRVNLIRSYGFMKNVSTCTYNSLESMDYYCLCSGCKSVLCREEYHVVRKSFNNSCL